MSHNSILRSFFEFITHPKILVEKTQISVVRQSWLILQLISLTLYLSLILAAFNTWLLSHFGFDIYSNSLINNQVSNYGLIDTLVSLIIIAPILEELAFRGWLTFNKMTVTFSTAFLAFTLYTLMLQLSSVAPNSSTSTIIFGTLITVYIILAVAFNLLFIPVTVRLFFQKHFRALVYFSILGFAFLHLFNYQSLIQIWPLAFLLILPQIIGASVLTFVRVRFGLIASIIAHSGFNLIPSLQFLVDSSQVTLGNVMIATVYLLIGGVASYCVYNFRRPFSKII